MARRHLRHSAARKQDGYLCDVSIERLLDSCRVQRVSGTLRIESWGISACIQWAQGEVRDAAMGALRGDAALREIGQLRDGSFALRSEQPVHLSAMPPAPVRAAEPPQVAPVVPRPVAVPPPLPVRQDMERPMAAAALAQPSAWPSGSNDAWPGQAMMPQLASHPSVPQAAYAVPSLVPRLRLPSVAVSVGILCATMLVSLVAIQM